MEEENKKMEEQNLEQVITQTDKIVNTDSSKIINTREKPLHNWGTQER